MSLAKLVVHYEQCSAIILVAFSYEQAKIDPRHGWFCCCLCTARWKPWLCLVEPPYIDVQISILKQTRLGAPIHISKK
jgi:hypothetical protein